MRDCVLGRDSGMSPGRCDRPDYQEGAGAKGQFEKVRGILMQYMDVKSAFRQVGVNPEGAANFGSVLGGYFIRLAAAARIEVEPGVVGGGGHLTGTVAEDKSIGDFLGHG